MSALPFFVFAAIAMNIGFNNTVPFLHYTLMILSPVAAVIGVVQLKLNLNTYLEQKKQAKSRPAQSQSSPTP